MGAILQVRKARDAGAGDRHRYLLSEYTTHDLAVLAICEKEAKCDEDRGSQLRGDLLHFAAFLNQLGAGAHNRSNYQRHLEHLLLLDDWIPPHILHRLPINLHLCT